MKLIIAGSRNLDIGYEGVDCALNLLGLSLPDNTEIVCGGAPGLWAGGEGAEVIIRGKIFIVDFEDRAIHVDPNSIELVSDVTLVDARKED